MAGALFSLPVWQVLYFSHPFTTFDRSSIFFVPEIGALEDMKRWIGNHVFSGFTLSNKYIYM